MPHVQEVEHPVGDGTLVIEGEPSRVHGVDKLRVRRLRLAWLGVQNAARWRARRALRDGVLPINSLSGEMAGLHPGGQLHCAVGHFPSAPAANV